MGGFDSRKKIAVAVVLASLLLAGFGAAEYSAKKQEPQINPEMRREQYNEFVKGGVDAANRSLGHDVPNSEPKSSANTLHDVPLGE